jgi:hypothetical protein
MTSATMTHDGFFKRPLQPFEFSVDTDLVWSAPTDEEIVPLGDLLPDLLVPLSSPEDQGERSW